MVIARRISLAAKPFRTDEDKLFNQARGLFAFWGMIFGMFLMGLSLAVAGVVQTYFNRVIGIDFLTTQDYMRLWFMVTLASAAIFATGAGTFIYDFFTMKEEPA